MRENKRPTGCNRMVFIAKLVARSTCFGHHYAHHQELKSYTDDCCLWYMAQHSATWTHNQQLHTRPKTCKRKRHVPQAATVCITLELLMIGIMVSETCWADNKFCNKNHSVASSWPFISTYLRFVDTVYCCSITVFDIWIQRQWNMTQQAFPPAATEER